MFSLETLNPLPNDPVLHRERYQLPGHPLIQKNHVAGGRDMLLVLVE